MMHERIKNMSRELNVNIMCYEYSGYSYATGSPSEEMCYRNIEAAYSYLRNILGIPASQIVLFGRSLGSGPSCYLAAKTAYEGESVAGLILHSPFLSIYRIVVNSSNLGVVGDMFPNANRSKDIRCPVFIIHGTEDTVVPFSHGLELLNSFPEEFRTQPFWAEVRCLLLERPALVLGTSFLTTNLSFLFNSLRSISSIVGLGPQ